MKVSNVLLAAAVIINSTNLSSVYALRNVALQLQNGVVEDDEQLLNNNMKELDDVVPLLHSSDHAYEPDRILKRGRGGRLGLPWKWKQPGGVRNNNNMCTSCVLCSSNFLISTYHNIIPL